VNGFDVDTLSACFRKSVLVLGKAVYRPSGRLLRIDASEMRLADESDRFFSKVPLPRHVTVDVRSLARRNSQKNGMAAVFGKWPGDETDEQIEAALRELS
jgi:hypothetical protein